MHNWLTENGSVRCLHAGSGKVNMATGARFVRVNGARVHVENNSLGRSVGGCSIPTSTTSKPCQLTLSVTSGHSHFVTIEGKSVCLETLAGLTESVPPSAYKVTSPGQTMVKSP